MNKLFLLFLLLTPTFAFAQAAPPATLSISPKVIPYGGTATLSWTSSNSDTCGLYAPLSPMTRVSPDPAPNVPGSMTIGPLTAANDYAINCGINGISSSGWVYAHVDVCAQGQTVVNNTCTNPTTNTPPATVKPTGTYTYWYFPDSNTYTDLSWDVTVNRDPSPGAYFYSTQFYFRKDDGTRDPSGGYFGIQTKGSNPTGKIAVFSIWDAVDSSGPEISIPFGGEGVGRSVRISYPWIEGRTYHLRVAPMGTDGAWWGAWIKDSVTGAESSVGQIKIAAPHTKLYGQAISFTENYVVTATTCSALEFSDASFTSMAMNSGGVTTSSRTNRLPDPPNCSGSYSVNLSNGSRHQMANFGTALSDYVAPSPTPSPASSPTPAHQSCTFNNQTIADGVSVTAYQSAIVTAGQMCIAQTRICSNGSLSGSYQYLSCQVQPASASDVTPPPVLPPSPISGAVCPNLYRNISFGMRGQDIAALQNFLIAGGYLATGNNTGYYGRLTQAAIQRWQSSYGIVSSGTPSTTGYGAVGPRTRAAIGAFCN